MHVLNTGFLALVQSSGFESGLLGKTTTTNYAGAFERRERQGKIKGCVFQSRKSLISLSSSMYIPSCLPTARRASLWCDRIFLVVAFASGSNS
jgi:hypothetical protein